MKKVLSVIISSVLLFSLAAWSNEDTASNDTNTTTIVSYHDYMSGFVSSRPGYVSAMKIEQKYIFGNNLAAENSPNPLNANYTFVGWGTVNQGTIGASLANVKYQAGNTLPSDGTVTNLYAYWQSTISDTITVTYDLNGGTLAGYPKTAIGVGPSFSTIMADAKGVRPPRGSGAFLKYWTEDPTGSGEHLMIDTAYNFTKDTTLYAQYARPARTLNINYGPTLLAANPTKVSITEGQTRMSIKVIFAICADPTLSVSGYRLRNETTGEVVILKNDGTGTNTFVATLPNPISDNYNYSIEAIWSTEGDTGLMPRRTLTIDYGPDLITANPSRILITRGQSSISIKVILAIQSNPNLSVSGYILLNETTGEIVILRNDGSGTNTFTANLPNPISDKHSYSIEAIWSTDGDTEQ